MMTGLLSSGPDAMVLGQSGRIASLMRFGDHGTAPGKKGAIKNGEVAKAHIFGYALFGCGAAAKEYSVNIVLGGFMGSDEEVVKFRNAEV